MKKRLFFVFVFVFCVSSLFGATLTVPQGYTVTETPIQIGEGGSFGGMDVLENGNFVVSDCLSIYEMTSAGDFVRTIYSTSDFAWGSFVRYYDGEVYFGESSKNTIKAVNYETGIVRDIATLAGNYDMKVYNDVIYIVAGNSVYSLENGTPQSVITTGVVSGALAFDDVGNVYYCAGEETYPAVQNAKNFYMWTNDLLTSGELLTESNATTYISNINAASGAIWYNGELFYTDSINYPAAIRTKDDIFSTVTRDGYSWMTLMSENENGFSVVLSTMDESYNTTNKIVTLSEVPEPSSLVALFGGVAAIGLNLKRKFGNFSEK